MIDNEKIAYFHSIANKNHGFINKQLIKIMIILYVLNNR
jgi:hypothetical protein